MIIVIHLIIYLLMGAYHKMDSTFNLLIKNFDFKIKPIIY